MSIEQNWKQFGEEKDDDLSSLLQPGRVKRLQSVNPLQKIKRNLFASMIWAVLFTGLYVYVLILFPYWQVIISIGVILLYTLWGAVTSFLLYINIQTVVAVRLPLLAEMEKQYKTIHRWMRLQLRFAIFAYPAGALGGFLIGLMFGSGKGIEFVETMLHRPMIVFILLATIAVLVPCGLYLGRRLLNKSFGRHMIVLKENIDALKEEK